MVCGLRERISVAENIYAYAVYQIHGLAYSVLSF
jgi:hypothetical protein